ncbi:MAG: YraN family protein [Phycisphaeraceae bacterium]|nr:YraN family protein [Phycisphaeraceae bacterium]
MTVPEWYVAGWSVVRSWLSRSLRGDIGRRGEKAAADYLRKQGYRVMARNIRARWGEIDIVALAPDGHTVVVVEVKSRDLSVKPAEKVPVAPNGSATGESGAEGNGEVDSPAPGILPEWHVNRDKQRKLSGLAATMARRLGWSDRPMRFDVIGVDWLTAGRPRVRHYVGAFESTL